ncbi:Clan SB, family S8, subtilisin-like serine peptidase [Trichomonas vaginalis G3]|uniref:Clan SB, family S8, subtilisin-like serine peptidase n=1 Tax=Trichomonas vaginalis (strain ATCC PRA-98 / G3) TaxID=412133 RepID=A2FFV0_TRIV3|nr:proprotein convertase-related family [Trichomonas vaginalis G3]EAX96211.1 Clan SB, family S8, subtilisin-like serine peptidase [Trichomonas vaginalis G3]KAI5496656.1 proprotein convertase-related family [Trichomonas vaginalis G3]|eukprot:XP_001309141.1 Clan SB, family S8, subtilisin-like serine peptidase [Trichomonas vaginalis G3]
MVSAPFLEVTGQQDIRYSRSTQSVNYGWFYIHLLVTLSSDQGKILSEEFPNKFETYNIVHPDYYLMHLNENEFEKMKNYKTVEIFTVKRTRIAQDDVESGDFLIRAYQGWTPDNPNVKFTSLGFGFFVVYNADKSDYINDPNIISIQEHHPNELENRFSVGFIQNPNNILPEIDNKHNMIARPLHKLGLTGKGQIVHVADSGIDYNHHFFYDPDHPKLEFNKTMPNHRKIYRYDTIADTSDYEGGHGSHVCGILAGKSINNQSFASQYDGIAPDAKIMILDTIIGGISNKSSKIKNIELDFDIEQRYKEIANERVGIASNSFGETIYTDLTYIYDIVTYQHKDILIVKSAGNRLGPLTVGTFGDSKNVFTVGNVYKPYTWRIDQGNVTYQFVLKNGEKINSTFSNVSDANLVDVQSNLLDLKNMDVSDGPMVGKLWAVIDNNEDICTIAQSARDKRAFGIVYLDEKDPCNENYVAQFAVKTKEELQKINNSTRVTINQLSTDKPLDINLYKVSSQGPGYSGVTKPDIVAPGAFIYSAYSRGNNSVFKEDYSMSTLITKSGTSMSCPLMAGSAALVRQYFMEGWFNEKKGKGFVPTASLLKAVIMNSGKPVNKSLFKDNAVGYGLPNLYDSLGFGVNKLGFFDNISIQPEEKQEFKIVVTEDCDLSITLSYADAPLAYTANRILYAQVNLLLEDEKGTLYSANDLGDLLDEYTSTHNRIKIKAHKGTYKVHVISGYFDKKVKIEYSLALLAKFSEFTQLSKAESEKICPGNCTGNGKCVNGLCVCKEGWTGTVCQTFVGQGKLSNPYSVKIDSRYPGWLSFDVKKSKNYKLSIKPDYNDERLRICFDDKLGVVGNQRQHCYESKREFVNVTDIKSSTGKLYLAIYKTVKIGSMRFSLEEDNAYKLDKTKLYMILMYSFAALFVLSVIVIIIVVIKCKKSNKIPKDQLSELTNPLVI